MYELECIAARAEPKRQLLSAKAAHDDRQLGRSDHFWQRSEDASERETVRAHHTLRREEVASIDLESATQYEQCEGVEIMQLLLPTDGLIWHFCLGEQGSHDVSDQRRSIGKAQQTIPGQRRRNRSCACAPLLQWRYEGLGEGGPVLRASVSHVDGKRANRIGQPSNQRVDVVAPEEACTKASRTASGAALFPLRSVSFLNLASSPPSYTRINGGGGISRCSQ